MLLRISLQTSNHNWEINPQSTLGSFSTTYPAVYLLHNLDSSPSAASTVISNPFKFFGFSSCCMRPQCAIILRTTISTALAANHHSISSAHRSTDFIRTSVDGAKESKCPDSPHDRFIVVVGKCRLCPPR